LLQFDLIALDQRVREQLLAHPLELGKRLRLVIGGDVDVDQAPDAGVADLEAEMAKRALDGLPLWVEDPRLRPNEDGRPPRCTTLGSAR
jgi:hypothetical protein